METEDDGAVLSMVSRGLGRAIMPRLSLEGVPEDVETAAPGPERPTSSVGCGTTSEQARSLTVRALIRELRAGGAKPPSQIVGSPSNCGDRPAELP
ncbi:LysR substrate-binding domain-containing protein [Streptomyces sp. NPDC005262]|uniref:LysR substrate-binding domain-containing protein n=1 Tax=Streptomyces sp. NPDC005262 TaxID=3364710 RepID=UPI00369A371F